MVFKIVRAGKRIRSLHQGLESETKLRHFLAEREERLGRHPLMEDMKILQKEVDWLRFSQPATMYLESMREDEKIAVPVKLEPAPSLPTPSIEEVLLDPDKWSGENVIMEGDLEFYNRNKNGDRWHIFSDMTGTVTAVSGKELKSGSGTLFGIAWKTPKGKQVFLEVKNFHPMP